MPACKFLIRGVFVATAFSSLLLLASSGCRPAKEAARTGGGTAKNATQPDTAHKPTQSVNLPVFIPITELQKQLYQLYFEPGYGKFYPCSGQNDCGNAYKDLYVENPMLGVQGNLLSIKLHLAGNMNALIFHPAVSGDITLTAEPLVSNDTLYFQKVQMQNSSQNFIFSIASALFEKQIVSRIQSKAFFSFRPALDKYTADFRKQTPLKWGNAALLLSLKKIYLRQVLVETAPNEGILADFSAILCTEPPAFGE